MKRLLFFLGMLLLLSTAQAQQEVKISAPRPKVGVVLGGGGAKGAAHIGVLKYLEELGVPVDYVAGTSMGSIMAGLYAMGYTPDELAELIAGMNWSEYIGNEIERKVMSFEVRKRRNTTILNVPFSLESLKKRKTESTFIGELPSAYVNNSSLINLFNDLCIGYQKDVDFNELPIPFACVSTDLVTGEEVVIRRGSVSSAIRASMAIPGVFAPVVMDDKVLVDGGLVNNFPADVLRQMGADIVIGVELAKDKQFTTDDLKSLPQVMARLLTNTTSAKRQENRELCDIYITPDISGYGMLSFNASAIDTLVNRGYRKAQEYQDQLLALKRYVDRAAGYPVVKTLQAPRAKNLEKDSVLIRSIEISGVPFRESKWMIRKGHLSPGVRYTKSDIEKCVSLYRGTGAFDDITYTVIESDSIHTHGIEQLSDAYDLTFQVNPAKPHVIGMGVHYDSDEGTSLLFSLGLNEKKFSGSKLFLSSKLSYSPRFNLTYMYSRSSLANFSLGFDYRDDHYKLWADVGKDVNMRFFQRRLTASVSQFHLLNFSTSVGVSLMTTGYDMTSFDNTAIDSVLYSQTRHVVPYANVEYDNLDDAYFATRGMYFRLASHLYLNSNNRKEDLFDLCYAFKYYCPVGHSDFTLIPQVYGRYVKDGMTPFLWNYYGGELAGRHFDEQLPFVGSDPLAMAGPHTAVLRCDLRYCIRGKHYLTGIYNMAWNLEFLEDHESGIGLKYSYKSLIGPVSLTMQWSEARKNVGAYVSIGYYF